MIRMWYILFYNYLLHFVFMTNYAHQVDIDIFVYEVCEPEIPTNPIVERLNLVEREN